MSKVGKGWIKKNIRLLSVVAVVVVIALIAVIASATKHPNTKLQQTSNTETNSASDTASATSNTSQTSDTASNTSSGSSTTGSASATPAPTSSPTPQKTLLNISGEGNQTTQSFTTGDNWSVGYTYDCTNAGGTGNFITYIMNTDGSENDDNGANELGASGGTTDYYYDAGSHYIEVDSECNWTLTVTG